jgi:hypothetical protein
MIHPQYPQHPFRIRKEGEINRIFDENRRSWVKLTPEEWVRQNFYQWLVQEMGYPASMIAIEMQIRLFELNKRFDMLVYNRDHQPWMMIECKAPSVPLNEHTLMQLLRYNMAVPVPYLVITNGAYCSAIERNTDSLQELDSLPRYPQ